MTKKAKITAKKATAKRQPAVKAAGKGRAKVDKPQRESKQQRMLDLLRRPEGASIADIGAALGWQAHTVRGVISAVVKKKLGLAVNSEKPAEGPRRYRLG